MARNQSPDGQQGSDVTCGWGTTRTGSPGPRAFHAPACCRRRLRPCPKAPRTRPKLRTCPPMISAMPRSARPEDGCVRGGKDSEECDDPDGEELELDGLEQQEPAFATHRPCILDLRPHGGKRPGSRQTRTFRGHPRSIARRPAASSAENSIQSTCCGRTERSV